jgi:hypothetical protein
MRVYLLSQGRTPTSSILSSTGGLSIRYEIHACQPGSICEASSSRWLYSIHRVCLRRKAGQHCLFPQTCDFPREWLIVGRLLMGLCAKRCRWIFFRGRSMAAREENALLTAGPPANSQNICCPCGLCRPACRLWCRRCSGVGTMTSMHPSASVSDVRGSSQ